LGLEIVRQQLEQGHTVFAISRNRSQPLESLIEQHPGRCHFVPHDLGQVSDGQFRDLAAQIDPGIPIQGLVNNAAVAYDDLVTNLDLDRLTEMLQVNLVAAMALTGFVIRNMLLHRTHGTLVHVSSIAAQHGSKGLSMYGASKGALESFSKNIAQEWGSRGIRSNCVVPGFLETEMSAGLSDKQKAAIAGRTALKQVATVESVAATVGFLLSPGSASITGQNLVVDAGSGG
jgi:3-oxoacyl-[acyl-carrier protein] reductase